MNLPNSLTVSRLFLAGLMMLFLSVSWPLSKSAALLIFIIAALTDYFDGYLARNVYGVTSFGRLMDPLTDKILVCAAFVSFVELKLLPAWIVVVIISREFLVTGLRLLAASRGRVIAAGRWGKHKTVWQIVAIVTILLGLAIQHDVLARTAWERIEDYRLGFGVIAYGIGLAVALITAATGGMYFLEHREIIRGHL